jgi:hypothetical protein
MPYKGGFDKLVTRAQFLALAEKLPKVPWAKYVMLHNTYRPTMAQEDATPGGELQRLKNLGLGEYKKKGWAGPHLFIFNSGMIGLGCPLEQTGVGSPGFNSTAWHVEMVADFTPGVDDDDAGKGFVVKDTACFVLATLLVNQGLDVSSVKLHKDDPKTSHKGCPGADIEKPDILHRVDAYIDNLSEAGEHPVAEPFKQFDVWADVPANDPLNVRSEAGLKGKVVSKLARGVKVRVIASAQNGATTWHKIEKPAGWASSKFLTDKEPVKLVEQYASTTKPAPAPVSKPVAVVKPAQSFIEPVGMDRPAAAVKYYIDKGIPEFKARAAVARFQREAYPTLKDDVWGDYMLNGKPSTKATPGAVGTATGLGQWRGIRLDHLRRYAAERQQPMDYLYLQLDFFLEEIATSAEVKLAREAWNTATNLEDAVKAMMHYERPRGYTKTAPEKGDGYKETMEFARKLA